MARLVANDVPEDDAAARIARAVAGDNVQIGAAFTGRADLYATAAGVVTCSIREAIATLNNIDEGLTLGDRGALRARIAASDAGDGQDHSVRGPRSASWPRPRRAWSGRRSASPLCTFRPATAGSS